MDLTSSDPPSEDTLRALFRNKEFIMKYFQRQILKILVFKIVEVIFRRSGDACGACERAPERPQSLLGIFESLL